jgi:hypothetical protein
MRNEMDIIGMDERQRICWLKANRVTLIAVGIVWIGMIAWEMANGNSPYFLIAAVPLFALLRFVSYVYYSKKE